MSKNNKILVIGSINMGITMYVERMPGPWETLEAESTLFETDGKASRIATAATELGASVSIIGKIGDDSYGAQVMRTLEQEGINVQKVSVVKDAPTGIVALIRNHKKQTSVINNPGANLKYTEGEILKMESFIAMHKIMILTNKIPISATREALEIAKRHNIFVIFDPSPISEVPPEILAYVDILLPNESDISHTVEVDVIDVKSSRLALSRYMELGVREAVILKIGEDGVLKKTHNGFIIEGSVDMTKEIDVKRDKDIFTAALSVSISNGYSMYQSLLYAKAAAQLSDVESGVRAAMPTKEELANYLKQNPVFEDTVPSW